MKRLLTQPVSAVQQRSKRLLGDVPVDLLLVLGYVAAAVAALTVVEVSSTVGRFVVGVPLFVLAPGYVTVAVLFPAAPPRDVATGRYRRGVTELERAALAFGLSVAVLPLIGLGIAISPWPFSSSVVVGAVGGFAAFGAVLGGVRRAAVPAPDRYRLRLGERAERAYAATFGGSALHAAANVVLVLSVLVALATAGYALAAPQDGERYTELQLLTESGDEDLVASDYPEAVEPGDPVSFVASVENREGTDRAYTAVVQEQWIVDGSVLDREELDRREYSLEAGGTGHGEFDVVPTAESGTVRISVLLYEDGVPAEPTNENADWDAYFWVDVTEDVADGGVDVGTGGDENESDDEDEDDFEDGDEEEENGDEDEEDEGDGEDDEGDDEGEDDGGDDDEDDEGDDEDDEDDDDEEDDDEDDDDD